MTTLTAATPSSPATLWPAGPRRPAGPTGVSFTAGDIWRMIRERMVLFLFIWMFIIGLAIGGTFLWILYYPIFRTEAYVRVESTGAADPLELLRGDRNVDPRAMELMVKDQAVFVTNPTILLKTIDEPIVKATTWYKRLLALNDPTRSPVDELGDIIDAAPIPDSSFLRISITGREPEELPDIVNTLVGKYMNEVNSVQKEKYRTEFDQLTKETESAKKLLDAKNAELDTQRSGLPASVTTGGQNPISERMMTLTALQVELEMQKLGRKQLYESLRDVRPDEMPITPEMQAAIDNDPQIFQLRGQVDRLQSDFNIVSAQYGTNHRIVRSMRSQLDSLKQEAMTAEVEKLSKIRNQFLDTAQRDYYQAVEQEQALSEALETVKSEQRDLDGKISRYLRDLEQREILKANYDSLLRQRDLLQQQLNRDKTVRISPVGVAQKPQRRAQPRWILNLPIGIVIGFVLAAGLCVLLELADSTVRTSRDVQRHASMPVLANIPNLDDEEVEIARIELASVDAPHSVIAEAFRQLRTNLFFSAPVEHQGALLVSSTGAEEGKTTIALNLAAAIAVSGRRVLLIDANFRRPGLRRVFPGLRAEGLSNILIGQSRLADVVSPSEVPSLDLLGTGPTPPNPAELLGSSYLRDLIADARSRYDQIIFDGPPILLVSDALVLAGAVDGVVMVCRFRSTSRGALLRARGQLDAINARVLGAVLNGVRSTRGGYYRKSYRAFYEYQAEEEGGIPQQLEAAAVPTESAKGDSERGIGDATASLGPPVDEDELARQIEAENRESAKGDREET